MKNQDIIEIFGEKCIKSSGWGSRDMWTNYLNGQQPKMCVRIRRYKDEQESSMQFWAGKWEIDISFYPKLYPKVSTQPGYNTLVLHTAGHLELNDAVEKIREAYKLHLDDIRAYSGRIL